ncbi:MAG: VOC family protein [Bdellovibrionota bacterium]
MTDKIQVCLWFDHQAEEAARFYASLFRSSQVGKAVPYGPAASEASGQPEGSAMTVEFELEGVRFLGLNGGNQFHFSPAISLLVGCTSEAEIDALWSKLSQSTRMPLQKYPFAEKYGWCQDRFGIDWQLILAPRRQKIAPALLFANQKFGKAEEAIRFYTSVIPGSEIGMIAKDEKTGAVLHSVVTLAGQDFVFMEGPLEHQFDFTPAISFVVGCESQKELDTIWSKLSAVPEAEQCGWLQDKYGVSWQIVPKHWGKRISDADPATRERWMEAVMQMKKLDFARLA